jgi:hypothetical protein
MDSKKIPVVLLKGAFLAHALYGDAALRPLSDIDLLCREGDLQAARDAVADMGIYRQARPKSAFHEQVLADARNHLPGFFDWDGKYIRVEIHASIVTGTFRHPGLMRELWENICSSSLEGIPLYHLCPEDQLIHLCLHLYHHMTAPRTIALYWFCDIHEWVTSNEHTLDWDAVAHRARTFGFATKVHAVLHLMRNHWRTPIPDDAAGPEDQRASLPSLAEALRFHREKWRYGNAKLHQSLQRVGLFRQIPGWSHRAGFLFRTIFPDRQYLMMRYGMKNRRFVGFLQVRHAWMIFRRVVSGLAAKSGFFRQRL